MTFPPRSTQDVDAYDFNEIIAGYSEWRATDPIPGDNRSEGYRWGWMNGTRDRAKVNDGFDHVRQQIAQKAFGRK